MSKIAMIAPNESIAKNAAAAQCQYGFSMPVYTGLMEEGVAVGQRLLEAKAAPRVLLSRGGTALLLREHLRDVHVVEIKMSLPDAVAAVMEAGRYGRKILVLSFSNHILGIDSLAELGGLEIHELILNHWQDAERIVKQAKEDGFDVVVGGAIQQKIAAEMGLKSVFLQVGETAIYNAYLEAEALLAALENEERKSLEIRTVLNYSKDGFVAIDTAGKVTLVNQAAATITGQAAGTLIGRDLEEAVPEIASLKQALAGNFAKDDLVKIGHASYLVKQITLREKQNIIGAMATLKSVSNLQSDENHIRYKQYTDGLYANYRFDDIIGQSPSLLQSRQLAERYAARESTVLIISESGTGKEMFAQSIHNASLRSDGPFVGINCASLSSSILESELFGYVDGAFTGAQKGGKAGVFEMANGGTIFLDEVGELPSDIQGKLLRVIQERCVMRLGATRMLPIDVRIIAATNRDLVADVRQGKFRQDLFFRLNVLPLNIPPLRQRTEDIIYLCELFLKRHGGNPTFSSRAVGLLKQYSWPGNIRELENLMERLSLDPQEDSYSVIAAHIAQMEGLQQGSVSPGKPLSREIVRLALAQSGGNKKKAAEMLGVHRSTLYRYLD